MAMRKKIIRLKETTSTNDYIRNCREQADLLMVTADFQTAGRGQGSNSWESEPGKNLLFSMLVHPTMVPLGRQFLLSMTEALALKEALDSFAPGFRVKWPNDIYWEDFKVSGTLIETTLSAGHVKDCIFGTGIDVNQSVFHSDAPNPLSLCSIVGKEVKPDKVLKRVVEAFEKYYSLLSEGAYTDISALYHEALYRRHGFFPYRDKEGVFEAAIVEVEDSGQLVLRDRADRFRSYGFKEISFILPQRS